LFVGTQCIQVQVACGVVRYGWGGIWLDGSKFGILGTVGSVPIRNLFQVAVAFVAPGTTTTRSLRVRREHSCGIVVRRIRREVRAARIGKARTGVRIRVPVLDFPLWDDVLLTNDSLDVLIGTLPESFPGAACQGAECDNQEVESNTVRGHPMSSRVRSNPQKRYRRNKAPSLKQSVGWALQKVILPGGNVSGESVYPSPEPFYLTRRMSVGGTDRSKWKIFRCVGVITQFRANLGSLCLVSLPAVAVDTPVQIRHHRSYLGQGSRDFWQQPFCPLLMK
jgi:hypothetical protein